VSADGWGPFLAGPSPVSWPFFLSHFFPLLTTYPSILPRLIPQFFLNSAKIDIETLQSKIYVKFDKVQGTRFTDNSSERLHLAPGEGGHLSEVWVGVCRQGPQTLTLFRQNPFISLPCLRQESFVFCLCSAFSVCLVFHFPHRKYFFYKWHHRIRF